MSIPLNILAAMGATYHHGNFCNHNIRDTRGMLETIRLGVEKFFDSFPQDQENIQYLAKFTRPLYILENEVDMWEETMVGLTQSEARDKLNQLRARVFILATKMGPAAEAYLASISPATSQPNIVEPWRRVSAQKLQRTLQFLKEAREEVKYHQYKEERYLEQIEVNSEELTFLRDLEKVTMDLLDQSNQKLELLELTKEQAQMSKEKAHRESQRSDRAMARAKLAEHQLREDSSRYEDQLAAANMAENQARAAGVQLSQEMSAAKAEIEALQYENFCLKFKNLKI